MIFIGAKASIDMQSNLQLNMTGEVSYEEEIELGKEKSIFKKLIVVYGVPFLLEVVVQPMFFFDATAKAEGYISVDINSYLDFTIEAGFDVKTLKFDADSVVSGEPF